MKKQVKIVIISAAVLAAAAGILFVVIPLATSKTAEARVSQAFTEAGIPEDMWSIERARYIPLVNNLVIEKLEFGERGGGAFLETDKITLTTDTDTNNIFAGSVDAVGLSFSANNISVSAQNLSVNDFSVDKTLVERSPVEAIIKLSGIHLGNTQIKQNSQTYISLGTVNASIGYVKGEIPLSSSLSIKEMVMNVRQFAPLPAIRPEYRFSNLALDNSFSNGIYSVNLAIDGTDLFSVKTNVDILLPPEIFESEINTLTQIDYGENAKIDSLSFTYTDKSFLNHVFELAGISGGRETAAEQLRETIQTLAMMGGIDMERFTDEAADFILNPGKLELKTNLDSPVSFETLNQNPLAMNLSLSINGGQPFTTNEP